MPEQSKPSQRETLCLVTMLFAFLVINLATATRYPFVWIDEVMYSDPAVNLLFGQGFSSTAWYAQSSNEVWAGNVPLHSLVLFVWLKFFGFSITSVRSINYAYMAVTGWLLWHSCIRLNLIQVARHRFLLLVLVFCGYSLIFSYRSGRPDCLGLFAMSAMLAAWCTSRNWLACIILFLLGVASPWVGLQLLPLLAVAGGVAALFLGRKSFARVAAIWFGALIGTVALVAFYKWNGVWEAFLKSTGQHTASGFFGSLLGGQFRHSNLTPKDFSFIPVFTLAILLALWQWRRGEFRFKSPLGFGLIFSLILTLLLLISGKFPTYYGWMTYVPLCMCVCATLSTSALAGWQRALTHGLLALAGLVGVGTHLVTCFYDWQDRDYTQVEQLAHKSTSEADWIYCDYGAYYATKQRGVKNFTPAYLAAMRPEEKEKISVLIIHPRNLEEVANVIGGKWEETSQGFIPSCDGLFGTQWRTGFLSMQNYRLAVFRRTNR